MATRQTNVLGGELEPCSFEPLTGYYRTGCCESRGDDPGMHVVCVELTDDFLEYSKSVGNDLSTPRPEWHFPGLHPGDRWCVVAARWLQAYDDGVAAPVVLAATNERALQLVPLEALTEHSVDVPDDPGMLG